MSIRLRLTLTLLFVTIVPTIGMVTAILILANNAQLDFVKSRSMSVNTEIGRQLDLRLTNYLESLEGLATSELVKESLPTLSQTKGATTTPAAAEARRELDEILPVVARTNAYEGIVLLDRQGTVLYGTQATIQQSVGSAATGIIDQAYNQASAADEDAVIILEDADADEMHHSLLLAHAYRDGRELQGVFLIHIPMANFQNILDSVRSLGSTAESYLAIKELESTKIVSDARKPIADSAMRSALLDDRGEASRLATSGKTGFRRMIDYAGDEVVASWGYYEKLKVGIVVKMDVTDALSISSDLRQDLIFAVSSFAAFLLIVILLITYVYVTKPLKRLSNVAEKISNGDYHVQVDHQYLYSNHEYGRLATLLHHIAHRLRYEHESPPPDEISTPNKKV